MACGRETMRILYRNLIRESTKWCSYNYREYALRKIRYEFRENRSISDPETIGNLYKKGLEALEMIKRQAIVGNMYSTKRLVIEKPKISQKIAKC